MLSTHTMLPPSQPFRRHPDPTTPRRVPSSALTHHSYLVPPPSSQPTPTLSASTPPSRPSSSQSVRRVAPRPTGTGPIRSATAQTRRLPAGTTHYLPPPASQPRFRADSVSSPNATGQVDAKTWIPQYDMPPPPSSQPRSAADLMMQDAQNRVPWGQRLLDAFAAMSQKLEASEGVWNTLCSDQKVMRDQIHALQTTMKGVPTVEDIREEMSAQLPNLVEAAVQGAIQPILDKMDNLPIPNAGIDAALADTIHTEMKEAQEVIIKALRPRSPSPARSPSSAVTEQPVMALMTHLINVLKPFQDLTSSIDALKAVQGAIPALKDLEPAFQDMILFAEAMRNINDKVIHVSPARDRNTSLSLQAGDGNEVPLTALTNPPISHTVEIERLNDRFDGLQNTLNTIMRKLDRSDEPLRTSQSSHVGHGHSASAEQADPLPDAGQTTPSHKAADTRAHLPTPTSRPQPEVLPDGANNDLGDFESDHYSPPDVTGFDVFGDAQNVIGLPDKVTPSPHTKPKMPSPKSSKPRAGNRKRNISQQESARKKAKKTAYPEMYDGPVTRSLSAGKSTTTGRVELVQEVIFISDDSVPDEVVQTEQTIPPQPRFVDPPSARTRRNTKTDAEQSVSQSQDPSYNTERRHRSAIPEDVRPKEEQTGMTPSPTSSDDSRASDYGETQRKAAQLAKSKASKAKKRVIPASAADLSRVPSGTVDRGSSSHAFNTGPEDLVHLSTHITAPSTSFTSISALNNAMEPPSTDKASLPPSRRRGQAQAKGKQKQRSATSVKSTHGAGVSHSTLLSNGIIHSDDPLTQTQVGTSRFGSLMTDTMQTQNSAGGQLTFPTKSTLQGVSQISEVYESMPETSASLLPNSFGAGPSGFFGGGPSRRPLYTYGSAAQRQEQGKKSQIKTPETSDESA